MGYIGHFYIDCLVNEYGGLLLLEDSDHRPGVIHVHDITCHVISLDYVDIVAHLSYKVMKAGSIKDVAELMFTHKDYLYLMGGDPTHGIVRIITIPIVDHHFGIIVVAPPIKKRASYQQKSLITLQYTDRQ